MNQFIQGLAMGGYGHYVWPAYGLAVGILILHLWAVKWQRRNTIKQLQRWFKRESA